MNDDTPTLQLPLEGAVVAGKYRLLSKLGAGGMGHVFLAEQLGFARRVAVKFLDPEQADDRSHLARFLREARIGLEVSHPGLVQVLDMGRDEDDRLFLCFEVVPGQNLRELLKTEGRLSFDEARAIVVQAAQALAAAHARGVVHRDIKPDNLFVLRDVVTVHVKVLDFGIAHAHDDGRLTRVGEVAGTPRYIAPEQLLEEEVDARVDQYALGLVLYELISGRPAISAKQIDEIFEQQLSGVLPSLGAPLAALDAVLARACAKKPARRYENMEAFALALSRVAVAPLETASPPPTTPSRPSVVRQGRAPVETRLEPILELEVPAETAPQPRPEPGPAAPELESAESPFAHEKHLLARHLGLVPGTAVQPTLVPDEPPDEPLPAAPVAGNRRTRGQ